MTIRRGNWKVRADNRGSEGDRNHDVLRFSFWGQLRAVLGQPAGEKPVRAGWGTFRGPRPAGGHIKLLPSVPPVIFLELSWYWEPGTPPSQFLLPAPCTLVSGVLLSSRDLANLLPKGSVGGRWAPGKQRGPCSVHTDLPDSVSAGPGVLLLCSPLRDVALSHVLASWLKSSQDRELTNQGWLSTEPNPPALTCLTLYLAGQGPSPGPPPPPV